MAPKAEMATNAEGPATGAMTMRMLSWAVR